MDYQTALIEFSDLLQIGAKSLNNIVGAAAEPGLDEYLREVIDIASRLNEIGVNIANIAARQH